MSTEEIRKVNEGVAVELVHFIGDSFWNLLYCGKNWGLTLFICMILLLYSIQSILCEYIYEWSIFKVKKNKKQKFNKLLSFRKGFIKSVTFILVPVLFDLELFLVYDFILSGFFSKISLNFRLIISLI